MESKLLPRSRIPSLYSDFRNLKDLNPEGYEANIRSWKQVLLKELLDQEIILQTGPELLEKLGDSQVGVPKSLDVVLDSMIAEGTLVPVEQFKAGPKNNVLSSVLSWTFNSLPFFGRHSTTRNSRIKNQSYLRSAQYIVVPTVERKYPLLQQAVSENICRKAVRYSDLVFSKHSFCEIAGFKTHLKDWAAFEVMMAYMEYYRETIVTDSGTVKVRGLEVNAIISKFGSSTINLDDSKIASVKDAQLRLKKQITHLESRIEDSKRLLVEGFQQKKPRELQKMRLRTQKILEKNLTLACQNLQNVEQLLLDIEAAIDRVHLKDLFENSRDVLTNASSQLGDLDEIEKLVDDINTERLKGENVDKLFEAELYSQSDDEIENELQRMDAEMKLKDLVLKRLSELEIAQDAEPQKSLDDEQVSSPDQSQSLREKQPISL
ncbi:LAME_0H04214g1_1 [Lachancea meyersii CBS 8951]|uniref:LAME_0H04214g1_1 n=1 Tax=Lachancea meyersii CBS 8951 TaxID=1266667 RepID=A0A1G4KDV3_9SACH|nr:LAME_0H04214g1_1 [Lachancea meyersii CBS 8951]